MNNKGCSAHAFALLADTCKTGFPLLVGHLLAWNDSKLTMALIINSNIASLNAQRQLAKSSNDLATASERLASGQRINSAADDAAGLAISNRMTSQIRGLNQAMRNAMDGVSMIQVAEGALDETTNILQRIRELAIQSSNGIYSDTDRATLDAEAQQLVSELDRIAESTSFNGQPILDGNQQQLALQVGADTGQTISFSIPSMNTSSLGLGATTGDVTGSQMTLDGGGGLAAALGVGAIQINGQNLSGFAAGTNLQDVIDDINTNVNNISAEAVVSVVAPTSGDGILQGGDALTITAKDFSGTSYSFSVTNTSSLDELVEAVNNKTGSLITASVNDEGKLTISSTTMASITVQDTSQGTATGINSTQIADADIAEIVEGLTSSWAAEAEARIITYFGLSGNGFDLDVSLVNEGAGGSLASVGPTGTPGVLELKIDMDDYTATGAASGGSYYQYMDRIIGHEMVHGAMFANMGNDIYTYPGWFIEGTAELIHGGDERVAAEGFGAGGIATAFGGALALGVSPATSAAYAASYVATKLLHQEILDAGGATGIMEIMDELKGGDTLDQALNTVGTARGLAYTSVAGFEAYFAGGTVADDFVAASMNLLDLDTGAIGAADYGGAVETAESIYDNNPVGLPTTFGLILPSEYSGGLLTSTAQLVLTAENDAEITISAGPTGSDADLTAFGFQQVSSGSVVQGQEVNAAGQNTALNANDLTINGVSVPAVAANAGLMAKIDAINDVNDETGVVASITAQQSFTIDTDTTYEYASLGALNISGANAGVLGLFGVGVAVNASDTAADIAAAINNIEEFMGVNAYADDAGLLHIQADRPIVAGSTPGGLLTEINFQAAGNDGSIKFNGIEVALSDLSDTAVILTEINAAAGNTGVTAAIDGNGKLQLTGSSAIQVALGNTRGMQTLEKLGISFGVDGDENLTDTNTNNRFGDEVFTIGARIKLDALNDGAIRLELTDNGKTATGLLNLNESLEGLVGSSLANLSVATIRGAQSAIDAVDNALDSINETRSQLGAVSNRLEFTLNNLQVIVEKTSASRSRIVDSDYAKETAQLSRAQILQQASQSMVAQANQRPQQVLQLLTG